MKTTDWAGVFNDQDEIKSKGMVRIAALAEWMNSGVRPRPDMIERRIKSYAKDFRMSEDEVKEMLSDATMAIRKGKTAYQYLTEGQPSHFLNAGKYMKYLKGLKQDEMESVKREIALSDEGQKLLLQNPNQVTNYTEEEKDKIRATGGAVPNYSMQDYVRGRIGKQF